METNEARGRMRTLSILLLGAFLLPTHASELIVPFQAYCMPLEKLQSLMNKYSEVPMINMSSTRILSDGSVKTNGTTLFANPKEKSWTLVEQTDDNVYCVIGAGMDLTPADSKNTNKISR